MRKWALIIINLCIIIGFILIAVFIIPKGKELAVNTLRTNKNFRNFVSNVVQKTKTAGKDVQSAYKEYLATMRSVSPQFSESGKIMTFEEFKKNRWERQGENTIDRWIQEYDLAKLFKNINKRDFYCWCQAKGYITLAYFHAYMGWLENWNPDKLAKYVPEYIKNPIPEKGKRVKYWRCLKNQDEYRTK